MQPQKIRRMAAILNILKAAVFRHYPRKLGSCLLGFFKKASPGYWAGDPVLPHQGAWLVASWPRSGLSRQHKTQILRVDLKGKP